MTDKWHPRKGITGIIADIWQNILILILFALIFYAGMVTGMYQESRENGVNNRKLMKIEEQMRELGGKVTVLEAVTRKK